MLLLKEQVCSSSVFFLDFRLEIVFLKDLLMFLFTLQSITNFFFFILQKCKGASKSGNEMLFNFLGRTANDTAFVEEVFGK